MLQSRRKWRHSRRPEPTKTLISLPLSRVREEFAGDSKRNCGKPSNLLARWKQSLARAIYRV
jgi:hypothetical protein